MEAQTTEKVEVGKLRALTRTGRGKGDARKLRAKGLIPAVIYGGDKGPVALSVNPLELDRSLDRERMRNTVFELTVEREDGTTLSAKAMLKQYQINALTQVLTHVDFIRVDMNKPVRVNVPLKVIGKSVGERLGGVMHQVFRMLAIDALPNAIPAAITGDVTALEIGDSLDVSDLVVPEGVAVALPLKQTVIQITAPRAATEDEMAADAAAAAAEGEGEGEEADAAAEEKA